jgi:hypothetical protein
MLKPLFLFLVFILGAFPAWALEGKEGTQLLGTYNGSVYRNNHFGFSVTVPKPWQVLDDKGARRAKDEAVKTVERDMGEQRAKDVEKAMNTRTLTFLILTRPNPKQPADVGSAVFGAENLAGVSIDATGYLGQVKKMLEGSKATVSIGNIGEETVSGQKFATMNYVQMQDGQRATQKFYAKIDKGYAVFFVLTYWVDQVTPALKDVMKGIRFD